MQESLSTVKTLLSDLKASRSERRVFTVDRDSCTCYKKRKRKEEKIVEKKEKRREKKTKKRKEKKRKGKRIDEKGRK